MTVGSETHEAPSSAIAQAVFDQVRRALPQDMAGDISLDSSLDEIGLDSLTRMGMLNTLEEAFGLRFSEDSLYDMVTCGDVIEYIEMHANGGRPRQQRVAPAPVSGAPQPSSAEEIPAHHYDVTQFPECIALQQRLADMATARVGEPVLSRQRAGQQGNGHHRRPRGGEFYELRLPGNGQRSPGQGSR